MDKPTNLTRMISERRKAYIDSYIVKLTNYYSDCSLEFFQGLNTPAKLNQSEKEVLLAKLNLEKIVGSPKDLILHKVLEDKEKENFAYYLLRTPDLKLEVNQLNYRGETIFIHLAYKWWLSKENFPFYLFQNLLDHGYEFKVEDRNFVTQLYNQIKKQADFEKWALLRFMVILKEKEKIKLALDKVKELYTLLSIKMGKPISFNFPNLLGVVNNAFQYYRENGDIFLYALKTYNRMETVKHLDERKGSFHRKYQQYIQNKPIQDKEFEQIAKMIFPELAS